MPARALARDLLPAVLAFALCPVVALLAPGPAVPLAHIRAVAGAERDLGLLFEPSLHGWAAAHPPLITLGAIGYVVLHIPVLLALLIWVGMRRPGAFAFLRNAVVATQGIAVAGYLLWPTAPPRMLPGLGYGPAAAVAGQHGLERLAMSPYAAMPSGHAAFALLVGGSVAALAARPWVRVAGVLWPALILGEILATGNHLWLDAVGGAVAVTAGLAVAGALTRRSRAEQAQPSRSSAAPTTDSASI